MPNTYVITDSVVQQIQSVLTTPEMGGILGIDETNTVVKFQFDSTGRSTAHLYIPDVKTLNRVIGEWHNSGIFFIGFVHSHAQGREQLSTCDIRYAEKIKTACGMTEILMLIYLPNKKAFHQYIL